MSLKHWHLFDSMAELAEKVESDLDELFLVIRASFVSLWLVNPRANQDVLALSNSSVANSTL